MARLRNGRHDRRIRDLFAEAAALRRWADANLPELERLGPYTQAMRLEQQAARLAEARRGIRGRLRSLGGRLHGVARTLREWLQR